jgi:hypothetical protein
MHNSTDHLDENDLNNPHNEAAFNTMLDAALLQYAERAAFSPMFAERVQRRIKNAAENGMQQSPIEAFADELAWMFRRAALVGAIVALLLAWYNVSLYEDWSVAGAFGLSSDIHGSVIESVFE